MSGTVKHSLLLVVAICVVSCSPSAVMSTQPSTVLSTQPSTVMSTQPSTVMSTQPSTVLSTQPSAANASPQPPPQTQTDTGVDISGCWQYITNDGQIGDSFRFDRVSSDSFVFSHLDHTLFKFTGNKFTEITNTLTRKAFYPPLQIHSEGALSEDGNTLTRELFGETTIQIFRRCAN